MRREFSACESLNLVETADPLNIAFRGNDSGMIKGPCSVSSKVTL